jgi:hypothetical protein
VRAQATDGRTDAGKRRRDDTSESESSVSPSARVVAWAMKEAWAYKYGSFSLVLYVEALALARV